MQDLIIYTIIVTAIISFLYFYIDDEDSGLFNILFMLISFIYIVSMLLPVLILYFNYNKYDKKTSLIIEDNYVIISGEK